MIYVFNGGGVIYDGSTITSEQKSQAVAVESLPLAEQISGKVALLRADKATNTVFYEYVDEPEAQRLQKLLDDALALLAEAGVL